MSEWLGLHNRDCRDVMSEMPDKCVDLTITSPPYNMNLRIRNGQYVSRQIVKELSTKYEGYDDNLPMNKYYEFNKQVIQELLRVSKLTFYNIQFLTGNKPALFKLIGDFSDQLKEFIIWDKVNSQPAIGHGVLNSRFEVLLVFGEEPYSRSFKNSNFERGRLDNLWQIKRERNKSKTYHGATFPTSLVELIIQNFSSTGEVLFDPFMGTGTTGVVAKRNLRKFVGSELLSNYFSDALANINSTEPQIPGVPKLCP